jgi:hypothetical protein
VGTVSAQTVLRIGLNDDPDALGPTISRAYVGRLADHWHFILPGDGTNRCDRRLARVSCAISTTTTVSPGFGMKPP